jgi:hypothetical protein
MKHRGSIKSPSPILSTYSGFYLHEQLALFLALYPYHIMCKCIEGTSINETVRLRLSSYCT